MMEQKLAFRLGDAVISEGPACISGSRLRCRSLHKGSCSKMSRLSPPLGGP